MLKGLLQFYQWWDKCLRTKSDLINKIRPTLGTKLALSRLNSPLAIMCKFPYLALTRLNSPKLAYSRHCQVDTNFNGRDPFNQTLDWSNWKWSTWKVDHFSVFSKLFQLDGTDPLSFVAKFPEILVEWIMPNTSSHSHDNFELIHKEKTPKNRDFKNYKQ